MAWRVALRLSSLLLCGTAAWSQIVPSLEQLFTRPYAWGTSPVWSCLVPHGRSLFQDAVQLTEKLVQEGKTFDPMFYPQESHGFIRDQTWIDPLRRTTDLFDRHLK